MHASIYNIYPNKATSYTVCITGPRHEQTKWIHLPASRVESESKYFPSSGMLHTHLPSFTIYCTSSRCKSRTGECECWSECSASLSDSPFRFYQVRVQVPMLFFFFQVTIISPSLYYITNSSASNHLLLQSKCNAMHISGGILLYSAKSKV